MPEPAVYDEYPLGIVLVSNLLSLAIYAVGLFLVYLFGPLWAVLYFLYILLLETRLVSSHCVDCYYYGKTCAFGRGRLCSRFFPQGSPERFGRITLTWKDMLPDLFTILLPLLTGGAVLVTAFRWEILMLMIVLVVLGFFGNAVVRGKLACRFCRQRELGCPAEKLFEKKDRA